MSDGNLISYNSVKGGGKVPVGMVRINSAWHTWDEMVRILGARPGPHDHTRVNVPFFVDVHANRGKAFVQKHDYTKLLGLCAEKNVDWVAISKVESPDEIADARATMMNSVDQNMPLVCAKIESKKGFENYLAIKNAADGIMVDQEDLATEVGWDEAVRMANQMYGDMMISNYPWFRLAGVIFRFGNMV